MTDPTPSLRQRVAVFGFADGRVLSISKVHDMLRHLTRRDVLRVEGNRGQPTRHHDGPTDQGLFRREGLRRIRGTYRISASGNPVYPLLSSGRKAIVK